MLRILDLFSGGRRFNNIKSTLFSRGRDCSLRKIIQSRAGFALRVRFLDIFLPSV